MTQEELRQLSKLLKKAKEVFPEASTFEVEANSQALTLTGLGN